MFYNVIEILSKKFVEKEKKVSNLKNLIGGFSSLIYFLKILKRIGRNPHITLSRQA